MNLWLLQTGEPLPLDPGVRKMRTGMLAEILLDRGHKVRWWASAFEHQRKFMQFDHDQEIVAEKGLIFHVLKGCGYKTNVSFSRYFDHRLIARKFRVHSKTLERPDGIIASLPCHHLAYEAVRYAGDKNVPILIDVRDLWPDTFIDFFPGDIGKVIGKIILSQDFLRVKDVLSKCDGISAMSHSVLDWALNKAGRTMTSMDNVFYMGYKKPESNHRRSLAWLKGKESQKIAVYIGTFGNSYELPLILKAARILQEKCNHAICFILAGTGDQEYTLRKEADDLSNVILPGWINCDEIRELLDRAWVGLVPCRSVSGALPNKVFEYLSAGLPVISSLEGEMAESIKKFNLGYNYRAGDLHTFIDIIEKLIEHPEQREKMSQQAASYFNEKGNAEKIYTKFAEHIEQLVMNRNQYK
jgi:glycosyltransferase involved in cell wall biosynthesis